MFGWLRNLIGPAPEAPKEMWWQSASGKEITITLVASGADFVLPPDNSGDTFLMSNGDIQGVLPMADGQLAEQLIFKGVVDGRIIYCIGYVTDVEDFS